MYNGLTVLGIIPARGGSKGIPGKNIKPLLGKPLISHTIEVALDSNIFDRLIVSTDDKAIAQVSKEAGADVPFIRPAELATDEAKGRDVYLHAMNWIGLHDRRYDLMMLLQPTSPLRRAEDIIKALELLVRKQGEAVVSVCETEHHPWWSNILPSDLSMVNFLGEGSKNLNRQQLPHYYRLNGAIYCGYWDFVLNNENWYGSKTYALIMPQEHSIDIDTSIDWKLASIMLKK
ncbi:MAG: acylneuraminate cytidylyltransferase family protein [Bacillota bacterium]